MKPRSRALFVVACLLATRCTLNPHNEPPSGATSGSGGASAGRGGAMGAGATMNGAGGSGPITGAGGATSASGGSFGAGSSPGIRDAGLIGDGGPISPPDAGDAAPDGGDAGDGAARDAGPD